MANLNFPNSVNFIMPLTLTPEFNFFLSLLEYAMDEDVTESHSSNGVGNGNCGNHQNRHESVFTRPTASMIYHPRNMPSNARLVIPAGILRIPVFSSPVALFSQESRFLFLRNFLGTPSGILSVPGLRT